MTSMELGSRETARPLSPGIPDLDPDGTSLDLLLSGAMDIGQFLRLAIGVAAALCHVHNRGLVHRDVKPANIVVNTARDHVWLMGLGTASRVPRERQAPEPPSFIAGTLSYMAPEQTGRMNRSVDSRSDLYALGVTFYEMLTGTLPFTAADPMELVHSHIAKQPTPPFERVKGIPRAVSAIIMKLLAKTAEERYQTAAGVESDLRRCLAEWETQHRIGEFPLGEHDVPDRLLIPEKLYGRETEIEALLAAFDHVVAGGKPELVLVSGDPGIGKSSVVNELHKSLVPSRGRFASGKFDQYQRDIPYATLAQALQSLVRRLLGESDAELRGWRDALVEALGPNARLMIDLVPELKLIIGDQPAVSELAPQDARRRFQLAFRRLIGVFARPEHPLALFLDDLQWLDAATLDLLEDLLTAGDVRHLLLIGAYRDNEVTADHFLMRKVEAIRKAGASVRQIALANLASEDVAALMADALRCEPERTVALARLVHEKTAGNPFFAIQFIASLAEEGLLTFDRDAAHWSWDLDRIHAKGYTDNVVDLMVEKLTRLPAETQNGLVQLACLGHSAETATLAMVLGASQAQVNADLWPAVRQGLVERMTDTYRFIHDRVQEAAYTLIPDGERPAEHLRIGRLLAAHTPSDAIAEHVFEIVSHFNRGAALITAAGEREQVAELNLLAGRRARASSAYRSALAHLATGEALLGDEQWDRRYDLRFSLALHRAECEFLISEFLAADERLSNLRLRAIGSTDLAAVACLRMALYTTGRPDRAIEVGVEQLRTFGIEWTAHPSEEEVRAEYDFLRQCVAERPIEALVDLPSTKDPDLLALMQVLLAILPAASFTERKLHDLAVLRMASLSLEHGHCDESPLAFAQLSMTIGPRFGDYRDGFRFGHLGVALVEREDLARFRGRVYNVVAYHVLPWTRPIAAASAMMQRALDLAQETGDLLFTAFCQTHLISLALASGARLEDVEADAERYLQSTRQARFGLVTAIITTQLALIRTLRRSAHTFGRLDAGNLDEFGMEHHLSADPMLAIAECWHWIRKMQGRYLASEYTAAVDAASKAQPLLWTTPSHFESAEFRFYSALSHAACWDLAPPDEKRQHFAVLTAHHRLLESWTEDCPENFNDRAALVGAEIARIEGRIVDAERLYEQAIRSAREQGFVHNEGLAYELAARFYATRGLQSFADLYLRKARHCYQRWGADGKVRQLDELYPRLRENEPAPESRGTSGTRVEQLELATVLKVSQAVSGEMNLDRLLESLMRAAIEHAGAERGLLIARRDDALQIQAQATSSGEEVTVHLRGSDHAEAVLPQSLVRYVMRTRETVILEDASSQNLFSADPYFVQHRARSILCLPLIHQSNLIAVLYLENNLAPRVFEPARITVLKLLASQAAMSLENTRVEQALRQSEAYLAEAQRLTHTASWAFSPVTGKATYWSDEMFRIYEMDARRGLPTYDVMARLLHPEDRERTDAAVQNAFRDKAEMVLDYRNVMADGTVRHVRSIGHPVLDKTGALVEYFGTLADVTERRRAEQRLLAQHRVARILAEAATMEEATPKILQEVCECMGWDIGVRWRIDREAGVLRAGEVWHNPSVAPFEAATRTSTFRLGSGLMGRVWESRKPAQVPDVADDPESYTDNAARAGVRAAFALPILLGSEVLGVIAFFSRDVWQADQDLLDMMATIGSQIGQFTKRAAAEQALRQSEAYLAEAQRLTHTGSWAYARVSDGRALYWSNETFRLFGLDPARRTAPTLEEVGRLIHPNERERMIKELVRVFRAKAEYEQKYRIVMPDGTVRHLHSIGHPVLDSSGELVEYVGTIMDVSERRRAEQRLLAQHRVARILAEAATMEEATPKILQEVCECMGWDVGVRWRIDRDAGVLRAGEVWHNPSVAPFEAATRRSTFRLGSGLVGRVWESGTPAQVPDVAHDPESYTDNVARAGVRAAFALPILLGSEVLGVIAFFSRDVWQADPDLLAMMATVGNQIGQFTKRAAAVDEAQLRVSMLHHIPVAAWSVNPDGTPEFVNQLWSEYTGVTPEYLNSHPDAWMAIIHPEDRERSVRTHWDGVRSGRGWTLESRLLRADDGTYRWHLHRAAVVRDSEGNILRFVGTSTDVHDWRQAQEDLRNTQAELAHTTRVLTMGELTASIAHEVNQPLGAIVASAAAGERWLSAEPPQMEKARRALERIVNDGRRAGEVIKRIRALMKRQAPQKDWLDLNEAILDVIAIAQHQLHRNDIVLATQLAEGLPLVRGDKVQLQQVLLNLIVNAIEAMSGIDQRRELTIVSATDGPEAVAVEVRDSGMGLDPERATRLFEPFYTTKSEGIGIGLSISRSIVEAHGGHLSAAANVPHGAVFRFSLPTDEPVP